MGLREGGGGKVLARAVVETGSVEESRRGLREGCESLDLIDPVGDTGEDARVDGGVGSQSSVASLFKIRN